jgi:transposase
MSAKGQKRRQWTAEEKFKILEEGRQPNTTVAEVLRRHQVDAASFYRWEREAKAAMLEALTDGRRPRTSEDKDREIERLQQELSRKSRVIAEVVEENLALKRGL